MNPCPENNKDADKSVPSAYSLFCVPETRFSTASFYFGGQAPPKQHTTSITKLQLWFISARFLVVEIDLTETFQSLFTVFQKLS